MLGHSSGLCYFLHLQKSQGLFNCLAILRTWNPAFFLRLGALNFHTSGTQCDKVNDCYTLLSLREGCNYAQLKDAYIRLAKMYHPDCGLTTADANKFSEVQQAYRIVKENLCVYAQAGESHEAEIEEPEIVFDIRHTAPQHRQYLSFDGIGYGNINQRERQYRQHRVAKATENVTEHRIQKIAVQYEDALVVKDKQAMKNHKTKNFMDRLVEDLIKESMEKGDFTDLPGTGKPLPGYSEINPFLDSTTHNPNKILINDGFAPEWIALERDIRLELQRSREMLAKERSYMGLSPLSEQNIRRWTHHSNNFRQSLEDINEKIRRYNMVVPILQKQMVEYDKEKEICKIFNNWESYLPKDFDEEMSKFTSYPDSQDRIAWKAVWTHIKALFSSQHN